MFFKENTHLSSLILKILNKSKFFNIFILKFMAIKNQWVSAPMTWTLKLNIKSNVEQFKRRYSDIFWHIILAKCQLKLWYRSTFYINKSFCKREENKKKLNIWKLHPNHTLRIHYWKVLEFLTASLKTNNNIKIKTKKKKKTRKKHEFCWKQYTNNKILKKNYCQKLVRLDIGDKPTAETVKQKLTVSKQNTNPARRHKCAQARLLKPSTVNTSECTYKRT